MMLLPTELTLRTTKEGIRLFNVPVKEVDMLQEKEYTWEGIDANNASEVLQQFNDAISIVLRPPLSYHFPPMLVLICLDKPYLDMI